MRFDGLGELPTEVDVDALTCWLAPVPLLLPYPPVPVNAAETVCDPTVNDVVL